MQHVAGDRVLLPRVAHAEAQPHEVRAAVGDDVAQSVVTAVATPQLQVGGAGWQVDFFDSAPADLTALD